MTPSGAVHQFHPACQGGDGITRSLFFTQKLLRRLGYESEIFCEQPSPALASAVRPLSEHQDRPGDVLLFHHGLGYRNTQWLAGSSASKVLVSHGITPDFLLPQGELRELSRLGRDQLQALRPLFVASLADSEENAGELRALGYQGVRVLPLVEVGRLAALQPNPALVSALRDFVNMVFVGRIAHDRRQAELVEGFNLYHRHFEPRARLHLVGAFTGQGYLAQLRRRVHELGLDDVVSFAGKVSDAELAAYFQVAHVYLSLSQHEGFGTPLLEAMALGVPVVAHASSSVPATVGSGGLLLETRDPEYVAATLDQVVSNAALRRAMRRGAQRSLGRFAEPVLERGLAELLHSLGGRPAGSHEVTSAKPTWRVEGAERALLEALTATGVACTQASTEAEAVTLRLGDPLRTEGMRGLVRVLHVSEAGLAARCADAFNQRLDLVTVPASSAKKVLIDAGVKVPIAVVGAVDEPASWARRTSAAVAALSALPQFAPAPKRGWLTPWNSAGPIAAHSRALLEVLPGPVFANRTTELLGEESPHVLRCWDSGAESLPEVYEQVVARGLDALLIQYDPGLFKLAALDELVGRLCQRGVAVYCICHSTAAFTTADRAFAGARRLFVHSLSDLRRLESCGLENASMLAEGKAAAAHLKNVIEACELELRFTP